MEQRREVEVQDVDVKSMGILLGVIVAAFVALGVMIYFFGEDQSPTMSTANNPPAQTEQMIKNQPADPNTVGRSAQ
jgi:hypothetical protein